MGEIMIKYKRLTKIQTGDGFVVAFFHFFIFHETSIINKRPPGQLGSRQPVLKFRKTLQFVDDSIAT